MDILDHEAGRVSGAGLYSMPASVYHADPAPEPSLSSTIAKLLITNSPLHAYVEHPRLGKTEEDGSDPTRPKEIGTAAHRLILGKGADVVVINADDYKTGVARSIRADAYAAGRAPILRPDEVKAMRLAKAVREAVAAIPGCEGFATAPSEIVAIVQDRSGAWLRIMMDRFEDHGTHAVIWDVKTGDMSAAPQSLGKRVESMGMEVQAALYVRVIETLFPRLAGRVTFRWIFIENDEPNALSVAEADNAGMGIGARKVDAAVHIWNGAVRSGEWPGYPGEIIRFDFPEWAANRWTEREASDPRLSGVTYDIAKSPFRPHGFGGEA